MKTYNLPPGFKTNKSPIDIIGVENYRIFKEHFEFWLSIADTDNPEKKIAKKYSKRDRANIAEAHDKLRAHGFVPIGIGKKGEIKWLIRLKQIYE